MRDIIQQQIAFRSQPIRAMVVLHRYTSFSSPVQFQCDDGNEYVVKGMHARRAIVNDQIIAHLGVALGAPVAQPAIVEIPPELVEMSPELAGITPGLAHGSLVIPNCADRQWFANCNDGDNITRFALLSVLYGWCAASDHQVIYENQTPRLVYSVDHGHFFAPGGPHWTIDTLARSAPPVPDVNIVTACGLVSAHVNQAVEALKQIEDVTICRAIAQPPDEWGMNMDEREALAMYLTSRRDAFTA